jgi:hypothetical protein
MKSGKVIEPVKYPFTRDEIRQLGADLARATWAAIEIEAQKKIAMADFASDKKAIDARRAELALKIERGFEMREMECLVYWSMPKPGFKTLVRADTGECVREAAMTPDEMQRLLDFGAEESGTPQ